MPTIEDQLKLEAQMISRGVERYRATLASAEKGDRVHETSYGSRLLKTHVDAISQHIKDFVGGKGAGKLAKYRNVLALIDPDKLAFMTLRRVLSAFVTRPTVQHTCISIGTMIEDELKFSKFQTEHQDYYDKIIADFKRKGTTHYRHMHRVLTHTANKRELEWKDWDTDFKLRVGAKLVDAVLECTELVEKKVTYANRKSDVQLVPTQTALDWIAAHRDHMELLFPDFMPSIIRPDEWTAPDQGGYYSPQLRSLCKLVKMPRKSKRHEQLLAEADMPLVYAAVNALQSVPWQVNTKVLEVFQQVWHSNASYGMPRSEPYDIPPCPLSEGTRANALDKDSDEYKAFSNWKSEAAEIHTMEKERVSKCFSIMRTLRIANEMRAYDRFWFVWQADFRGRWYVTTAGLSPQGADTAKGLLQFAEGKSLGEDGVYWLKVHGANKAGFDKGSYDERVHWIEARHDALMAAAGDPMKHWEVWAGPGIDKPWQFLAFIFEYAEMQVVGPEYRSHLPIALDGSCNGLQNFSAMLRDEVGGAATNLTPGSRPADIYSEVGAVVTRKLYLALEGEDDKAKQLATKWLDFFEVHFGARKVSRKLAKKPVMTLPYGSTMQACTSSIFKLIMETDPSFFGKNENFAAALFLSPLVWKSIGEVVIAARSAMDWIQKCSGILASEQEPLEWISPLGFPVYQAIPEIEVKKIETQIAGRIQLRIASHTDKLDKRKQRQGSSPNLVHHADATHLNLVVNKAIERGITNLACIHDDFGTHACDTTEFHKVIREAFIELHGKHNVLAEFKRQNEERTGIELPDLPPSGSLRIEDVREAEYFFG